MGKQERMSSAEYRKMMAYNFKRLPSESFKNKQINQKQYTLLDSIKKIDSEQNKRPAKYRNRKVEFMGMIFDSEGELKRWIELLVLKSRGDIENLDRQITFDLLPKSEKARAIKWRPDFIYYDCKIRKMVVEDFKQPKTEKLSSFRMKVKLFMAKQPDFIVRISTMKGVKEWK